MFPRPRPQHNKKQHQRWQHQQQRPQWQQRQQQQQQRQQQRPQPRPGQNQASAPGGGAKRKRPAPSNPKLAALLDEHEEDGADSASGTAATAAGGGGDDEESAVDSSVADAAAELPCTPGACVECDAPSRLRCEQCQDEYCPVCFQALHRTGKRAKHVATKVLHIPEGAAGPFRTDAGIAVRPDAALIETDAPYSPAWFVERAKFIPLRLSMAERKRLRLLQAALKVCTYTDTVDQTANTKNAAKHQALQTRNICAVLLGMVASGEYAKGQTLASDMYYKQYATYLRSHFEIGRRHKIMNPDSMRDEYGKMIYILQDSNAPHHKELLQFSLVGKLQTVYDKLEAGGCAGMLANPLVKTATMEIVSEGKQRAVVQQEIRAKENAVKQLSRHFSSKSQLSEDDIQLCLYSIADNHSYLRFNRTPIDNMLRFLTKHFHPKRIQEGYSLAISGTDKSVARINHDHERQFAYVQQSLRLWQAISNDMFRLWTLAEQDLLGSSYTLQDTGQGLNRVQECPRVMKAMKTLLHDQQVKGGGGGSWVGSSVVHLGDRNVPNSLIFIDKYNQVGRILLPIVRCLEQLPALCKDPTNREYIEKTFGGPAKLKMDILHSFFTGGFNGAGADNFFDAGSCIDGRLTSAWNWCSKLSEQPFYKVFLLAGFVGFDGEFA